MLSYFQVSVYSNLVCMGVSEWLLLSRQWHGLSLSLSLILLLIIIAPQPLFLCSPPGSGHLACFIFIIQVYHYTPTQQDVVFAAAVYILQKGYNSCALMRPKQYDNKLWFVLVVVVVLVVLENNSHLKTVLMTFLCFMFRKWNARCTLIVCSFVSVFMCVLPSFLPWHFCGNFGKNSLFRTPAVWKIEIFFLGHVHFNVNIFYSYSAILNL